MGSLIGFDPQDTVDTALENGELVKVFDWRELDPTLTSGDVQLSIFDGLRTDATPHPDRAVGLRLGFAGTTLDELVELFADGFESGQTDAWTTVVP